MSHFFKLKLTLSTPQAALIEALKSRGLDVIQLSDGLAVRSPEGLESLQSILDEGELSGVTIEEIDTRAALDDASVHQDLKAFIQSHH